MPELKPQYDNAKAKILNDISICKENRALFGRYLEFQETKGKRSNGLPILDDACYKTLLAYLTKFRWINTWFENKPLRTITKEDILRVYEDLEEGRIVNKKGGIYKDRKSIYNKIFKSELFKMIGKDEMAKQIIKYNVKTDKEVRFIEDFKENLKKIVKVAIKPEHKGVIQICGDYSENVGTIIQLEKRDFTRRVNEETGEVEYLLNFRKEILKRSRTPRTEINIFQETVEIIDKLLEDKKANDKIFNFGLRQMEQVFDRAVKIAGVKLQNGERPTLKDLRSSVACYLLDEGWTTDEIKSRLGHKPSSDVLDVYVTYKAMGKTKLQAHKKIYQGNIAKLQEEIEKNREVIKLQGNRIAQQDKYIEDIKKAVLENREWDIKVQQQQDEIAKMNNEIIKSYAKIMKNEKLLKLCNAIEKTQEKMEETTRQFIKKNQEYIKKEK